VSTESITSPVPVAQAGSTRCSSCGSPVASDQRYCLECGERQVARSSFLAAGPPTAGAGTPPTPPAPVPAQDADAAAKRASTLTALAGIGLLLLAMGVGVLIGRAGSSKPASAAPQVITVGSTGGGGAAGASAEVTFTSDWPSGTTGYTVQLQTLPSTGTSVAAVEAAKTAATAKGAAAVGALKSDEFSSLPSGSYIIYSGDFHKKAEAQKALEHLKKSFPAAKVLSVSNGGSAGSSGSESESESSGTTGGVGNNLTKPAPPSTLQSLAKAKGKNYAEKSKNLPNVISTGP